MGEETIDNGKKIDCGLEDEIVSYIYDELSLSNREKFESHLIECTNCTDEFAAISYSRFSVYEWQREEFADLPTPVITVPYPVRREVDGSEKVGFLSGLRGLFTVSGWPVTAVALVIIAVGIGFVAFSISSSGGPQIAANISTESRNTQSVAKTENLTAIPVEDKDVAKVPEKQDIVKVDSRDDSIASEQPVKVSEKQKSKPVRNFTAETQKQKNNASVPASNRAPVLGTYDDTDDRSLRLSDLFSEDIGVKR